MGLQHVRRFHVPASIDEVPLLGATPQTRTGLIQIAARGVEVVRQGVTYRMFLNINQDDPEDGGTPFVDVLLARTYGHGALQIHFYEFQTPLKFPFDGRLQRARFDSAGKMGHSSVVVRYRASGPVTITTCKLFDGGMGRRKETEGTLSFSAFSIRTGTKPFFGSVAEQPQRALLVYDPGCVPSVRPHKHCPGPVSIAATGTDPNGGPILYADSPSVSAGDTVENILDGETIWHGDWPENIFRFASATVPDADLPPPTWGNNGASGSLETTGVLFGTGAGAFSSTRKPDVRHGLTCRHRGVRYTYTLYHYRGVFMADPQFVDFFVTGDRPIPGRSRGDLYIAEYGS